MSRHMIKNNWFLYAAGGGVLWTGRAALAAFFGQATGPFGAIELLLEFGMLVNVPLLLGVLFESDRHGRRPPFLKAALYLYPLAATLVLVSAPWATLPGLEYSPFARALLAAPYFCFTLLVALHGAGRFLGRGRGPVGAYRPCETAIDAGLVYIAVGGVWLVFDRAGWRPMDFPAVIVLLTVVHFHFAGFALPILGGLLGRRLSVAFEGPGDETSRPRGIAALAGGLYPFVASILILGPILVALGITFSPLVEVVTGAVLALGVMGFALLQIVSLRRLPAAIVAMIVPSSLALLCAMVFAMLFAYGEYSGREIVSIPAMILPHGLANSIGVFLAVLARVRRTPPSGLPPAGIPFSRLRSGGRVGADFLEREKLLVERRPRPRGLVDNLEVYAHGRFDPSRQHPDVRAFYERTEEFELLVRPRWRPGFRTPGRVYKLFSAYVGQMNFPISPESPERKMDSRIQAIDDARDGRTNVRAWTRCFAASGRPLYVATYSHHRGAPATQAVPGTPGATRETYMNIAFPHVGGNLSSILRLESLPIDGSRYDDLVLSTLPRSGTGTRVIGDEGVYYATALGALRTPINETIRVWPANAGEKAPPLWPDTDVQAEVMARHDMWFSGLLFLTLDYYIYRA